MGNLFNMDNRFFTTLSRVADLMILNIIFLFTCIPIITIGPALSALYTVTLKQVKNEESYIFRGFLKAFKENFKQSLIIWMILLIFLIIILADIRLLPFILSGKALFIVHSIFLALFFIWFLCASYVFPLQAKFYNPVKTTIRNAFYMGIRHLPFTILIILINLFPVFVYIIGSYVFYYGILFYFLVGFALEAFMNSYLLQRIFAHYIKED
ncbi:MAG TPA: YesL family protein [Lachnospiraceae bacterium]